MEISVKYLLFSY